MPGLICTCSHAQDDHKQADSVNYPLAAYVCTKCECVGFTNYFLSQLLESPRCSCGCALSEHVPGNCRYCAARGRICLGFKLADISSETSSVSNVDHPSHYGGKDNVYETIKVVEAWSLNFNIGNCVKYLSRAGKKDPTKLVEDLEKALFYLKREIDNLKK